MSRFTDLESSVENCDSFAYEKLTIETKALATDEGCPESKTKTSEIKQGEMVMKECDIQRS